MPLCRDSSCSIGTQMTPRNTHDPYLRTQSHISAECTTIYMFRHTCAFAGIRTSLSQMEPQMDTYAFRCSWWEPWACVASAISGGWVVRKPCFCQANLLFLDYNFLQNLASSLPGLWRINEVTQRELLPWPQPECSTHWQLVPSSVGIRLRAECMYLQMCWRKLTLKFLDTSLGWEDCSRIKGIAMRAWQLSLTPDSL